MIDFSKLFLIKIEVFDIFRLKKLFELPRVMSMKMINRTKIVQKDYIYIKNLDLNDLEVRKKTEDLFLRIIFDLNNVKINNGKIYIALGKIKTINENGDSCINTK